MTRQNSNKGEINMNNKNKNKKLKFKENNSLVPEETSKRITIPITYPNKRDHKTNVAIPSDLNVEYAKEWVDFNQK